jgi:dTDP-4-dehydrorhamnose reductase
MSRKPVILILGASGQVGTELQQSFADAGDVTACDRRTTDLSRHEELRSVIRRLRPSVILNAAAYTAVDKAESEPELAMTINGAAPGVIAEEAAKLAALLVHYSTDYVFNGAKKSPWVETDPTHPLNMYGQSKLTGERAIQQVGGRYLIFRTSWVYGPRGHNFLRTMLRLGGEREQLKIVDDQFGAPTSSLAIAKATRAIVDKALVTLPESGVYHMTSSGETTWYRFAEEIFSRYHQRTGEKIPAVIPISSSDYPTPATRPSNSVLSNEKLQGTFGTALPDWRSALSSVMGRLDSSGAR